MPRRGRQQQLDNSCSIIVYIFVTAVCSCIIATPVTRKQEEDPSYWNDLAKEAILQTLQTKPNTRVAKNVLFFLGDGLSIPTLAASRIFKGQLQGRSGEEEFLEFEKFPHVSLVKTYNVDRQVPDSAGTATAFLCGVKANYETIGVSASARFNTCETESAARVKSIMDWAQEAGKDTGVVTTTRITHATPAGAYAHTVNRDWEADVDLPGNTESCKDIARQLVEDAPGTDLKELYMTFENTPSAFLYDLRDMQRSYPTQIDVSASLQVTDVLSHSVIFGGGRQNFYPLNSVGQGKRMDGKNLVEVWQSNKMRRKASHRFVATWAELNSVDLANTDYLLGLFANGHLAYESDPNKHLDGEPTLEEMTTKAIEVLKKSSEGFVLLVEGGRIDHAHHDTYARRALEETLAMEKAIKAAMEMVNLDETLIVVTADHAHVMTVNGYPLRGTDILGLGDVSDHDHLPYTTLMYTNGPGFNYTDNGTRYNLTLENTTHVNYQQLAAVPLSSETHGGDDVAVFARGPMAHLFQGLQEQNYVAHVMAYAACIGPYLDNCPRHETDNATIMGGSPLTVMLSQLLLLIVLKLNWGTS